MGSEYTNILDKIVKIGQDKKALSEEHSFLKEQFFTGSSIVRAYASWALSLHRKNNPSVYHVSGSVENSSDDNSGTEDRPWKTLQKAAETAIAGDTVIVHGGVYRECVRPFHSGEKSLPIRYEAAEGETPVVKASDIWQPAWKAESHNLYSTQYEYLPWDKPNRFRPNVPENRCEQIFVDGLFLRHVKSRDVLLSQENSFWINDTLNEIWVNFNENPNKCVVERSVREQCFMPAVRGLEHIQVRGLTFVGGAAHPWTGAKWHHVDQMAVVSVNAGRNWLIEDNVIEWGNAQGLQIAVGGCFVEETKRIPIVHAPENFDLTYKSLDVSGYNTIRKNKIRNNGISGIVGFVGMNSIIIEDNEVTGNCRKDFKGTCEEAGMKFHVMVDSVIRRNIVSDNDAYGIWLDGLCKRNRITQNILVNNNNTPIFYELSEGPTLIDNNVIMDTRDKPVEIGLYNQDGNQSTVINNAIIGPEIGVRVRALFHRRYESGMTTTIGNRVYNNVISHCKNGCVSLMPEVSRCSDNHSDHNLYWAEGGPVFCRVENTSDVGVPWESLPLGRALGYRGEGNHSIKIEDWKKYYQEDCGSSTIPDKVAFECSDPHKILATLITVWLKRGLSLGGGLFEMAPIPVSAWIQHANSRFEDSTLKHTIWTAPFSGVQIWETLKGLKKISWNHKEVLDEVSVALDVPYIQWPNPIVLAAGDSFEIEIDRAWRLLIECPAEVTVKPGSLLISTTEKGARGDYCATLVSDTGWTYVPITVVDPFGIEGLKSKCTVSGKFVLVSVINRSDRDISGKVLVEYRGKRVFVESCFLSHTTRDVEIPIEASGEEEIYARVEFPGTTVDKRKHLSFAEACKTSSWKDIKRYDIKNVLPTNIFSKVLDEKRTSAGWRVRYTDEGIHFRVEVEHKFHNSSRSDMKGIHCGDCVKICLKGNSGGRATVVGLTLRSDTGEQVYGFNKTANEEKYPEGNSSVLRAAIAKRSSRMIYDVLVTWDMIGLSGPMPGSPLSLSILVCKDDEDIKYEMLWFGGIRYDESEGKESEMGLLWLS
jgi:hypothetical protein